MGALTGVVLLLSSFGLPYGSDCCRRQQVAELIAGLQELGCTRTTGEDQTVCVMSDSFDQLGNAEDLQASGDLPQVEVVKVGVALPRLGHCTDTVGHSTTIGTCRDYASPVANHEGQPLVGVGSSRFLR